jgi:hypothetical protein
MTSFIWFTRCAPSPLAAAVAAHGGLVIYEAIAVSEVLALMERQDSPIVIIDPTVEEEAARELQKRFVSLRLQTQATAAQILWELTGIVADPDLLDGRQ